MRRAAKFVPFQCGLFLPTREARDKLLLRGARGRARNFDGYIDAGWSLVRPSVWLLVLPKSVTWRWGSRGSFRHVLSFLLSCFGRRGSEVSTAPSSRVKKSIPRPESASLGTRFSPQSPLFISISPSSAHFTLSRRLTPTLETPAPRKRQKTEPCRVRPRVHHIEWQPHIDHVS